MSQNEEKTAEELAYYVKSDLDIENIMSRTVSANGTI